MKMSLKIAEHIDSITSDSDSAEETLVKLRELQAELVLDGDTVAMQAVKDFADEWEDIMIS